MRAALEEAALAVAHGDVPVGAVVARRDTDGHDGELRVIARCHNRREVDADPTAHAEILALRAAAAAIGNWRLDDHLLVVTLEPCAMCAGAMLAARIATVVFGAPDPKAGAAGSLYNLGADPRLNHNFEIIGGVLAEAAGGLLRDFFAERRTQVL